MMIRLDLQAFFLIEEFKERAHVLIIKKFLIKDLDVVSDDLDNIVTILFTDEMLEH